MGPISPAGGESGFRTPVSEIDRLQRLALVAGRAGLRGRDHPAHRLVERAVELAAHVALLGGGLGPGLRNDEVPGRLLRSRLLRCHDPILLSPRRKIRRHRPAAETPMSRNTPWFGRAG